MLLELNDVRVSFDGFLFKLLTVLPESFAFPASLKQWKLRSFIKFFTSNYFNRRTREVARDALWTTDDWSYGYFHWLTDALTRLYVVRERLHDFVLLLPSDYESLDFVQASLKCFGVRDVEYVGRNEVLRCRRLFMPTHTAPSGNYNEAIIREVRALLLRGHGDADYRGEGERIYISRGRAPKRKIVNEDAVREMLETFGFQIIYAEDHSFAQQVHICSRARYLVSNHGAGLTNMLFMPEGASVLELRHHTDAVNNCYFTLSSALNLRYFYQTCLPGEDKQDPHTADLVVDLTTLKANLRLLLEAQAGK
jgi:capsular polysaccharide biosynthesis protein